MFSVTLRRSFKILSPVFSRALSTMAVSDILAEVPEVEIDPDGTFKYVLIKVYPKAVEGAEPYKYIVRGFSWGAYHSDIYDVVSSKLHGVGVETECVGGGRIQHDAANKKIKVYGYSQGFGKADHLISANLLKQVYANYEITTDDGGY